MNSESRRAIGERLKEARKSIQLTQAQAGKHLGVERQTVSKWENGETLPASAQWFELGLLYGASLDYLVYGIRTVPVSKFSILEKLFQRPGVQPPAGVFGTPERQPAS